ncbi:MAG: UDP-glucose 6-dehydrogenase [Candidatus Parcubacteria bacterium]|jgi:nucleotide sugar dehydrogenase
MTNNDIKIGFIGQGWIGKHYADDFQARGYETVRFALDEPYLQNKDKIADCDITFIAVPTPTTPDGFDASILKEALTNIGVGKIVVVKSTTLPGVIAQLQTEFPEIIILHSPEFLVEKTAAFDAANPNRNIIGIPVDTEVYKTAAQAVLAVLPKAPYEAVMSSLESEILKYAGNCFLYTKVLFMNSLYDVASKSGANFATIRDAMVQDPRIGISHTDPIHSSGRGAGGHCFIKDFEAFRRYYEDIVGVDQGSEMLATMVTYNNHLLLSTNKDLDLLTGVYGDNITPKVS